MMNTEKAKNTDGVKPPGFEIPIDKASCVPLSDVKFSFEREFSPSNYYPPMVAAVINESGDLQVQAIFFLRTQESIEIDKGGEGFSVFMKEVWTGTLFTPEFLIEFADSEQQGGLSKHYLGYTIEFTVPKESLPINPNGIRVYLWNTDPEGSRGTVTTVQSGG